MRRWLVAAFVGFHALAITLSSLPSPGAGVKRTYWDDPTVQAEFRIWSGMLGVESETLQDQVHAFAVGWNATHNAMMKPFRPYLKLTNTRQTWKMFIAPHRFPSRMQLQVRAGPDTWETVFEERSETATWRRERFDNERMRASIFAWSWPENRSRWEKACEQFAAELFEERPEAEAVRCRFRKTESPTPAEVLADQAPDGRWALGRTVLRSTVEGQ